MKEEVLKVLIFEKVKKLEVVFLDKFIVYEEIFKILQVFEEIRIQVEVKVFFIQMSINDGQKVILKVNIVGVIDVKWVLNGVELINFEEYRYGVLGSDQILIIKQVGYKDVGIFICIGKIS